MDEQTAHEQMNETKQDGSPLFPHDVAFSDAEKVYNRLVALWASLEEWRFSPGMTQRDTREIEAVRLGLQSTANQLFIASHSGAPTESESASKPRWETVVIHYMSPDGKLDTVKELRAQVRFYVNGSIEASLGYGGRWMVAQLREDSRIHVMVRS